MSKITAFGKLVEDIKSLFKSNTKLNISKEARKLSKKYGYTTTYIRGIIVRYRKGEDISEISPRGKYGVPKKKVDINHYIEFIENDDPPVGVSTTPITLDELIEEKKKEIRETTIAQEGDGYILKEYKGARNITTREEYIEFYEIDTNLFDVVQMEFKQWSTPMKLKDHEVQRIGEKDRVVYFQKAIQIINYYASGKIMPRQKTADEVLADIHEYVKNNSGKKYKLKARKPGTRVPAVWGLADFHLGLTTEGYNVEKFIDRCCQFAEWVEANGSAENHILLLGDFVENGPGSIYMHSSQAKETEFKLSGLEGGRAFWKIFNKYVFARISNLASVTIIPGNHDRGTKASKDAGPNSTIAKMIYWFCNDNLPIPVYYDYTISKLTVDGVCYLSSHGDLHMVKKLERIVKEYGDAEAIYTVLLTGHLHTRKSKQTILKKSVVVQDVISVVEVSDNCRSIQLPAVCDRNSWAKRGGMSSIAGFCRMERARTPDGKLIDTVRVIDYALD